ncbi:hypothetical protein MPH_02156 [Macrophomina phaseolina MS6]|uniref:Monooxygenase FAD-binding protein n=1 Tax=Macrophomina phaseolina (strain MS6) TaxID=1126212 RepID=K2SDZ4_MACPH|nr:hypothetical protein MPH_02156 [Macrophomina phaseolina MS6]
MIFFERRMVIEVLYKHIRQKNKVLTSKRVAKVEENADRVAVVCEDGDRFEGSIVIGADGIHSKVSEEISRAAEAQDPQYKKGKTISLSSTDAFSVSRRRFPESQKTHFTTSPTKVPPPLRLLDRTIEPTGVYSSTPAQPTTARTFPLTMQRMKPKQSANTATTPSPRPSSSPICTTASS